MSEPDPEAPKPPTALPLVDVFASVPVEGAVFTTYTLSLAWFETHLLRSLELSGAKQILLLADPVGVNASLGEGLVTGPGIRYAVEPVEAPHGAFHAKVGVVWSRDALLLAVGSGNLTFAGMHRNLECWELLTAGVPASSDRLLTRGIAEEAVQFLAYLTTRVEAGGRAAATLGTALAAVTNWIGKLPATGASVRWMDSTRTPIGEQVVAALGKQPMRALQVLSPFHDRDGAAVVRLAEKLSADRVDVLYVGETTTFPVGHTRKGLSVSTFRLDIEDPTRPLHAKVFRFLTDDGEHLLSGSANGTSKALWTTGNVEVSLLRTGTFDDLLPMTPGTPDVSVLEYQEAEPRPLAIQWARASDDHVRAHLRWSGPMRPSEVLVGFVDSLEAPTMMPWPVEGTIRVRLPVSFSALRPRALRIEATVIESASRWYARAWVAFDELLNASREFRAALNAWNRLLSGEDDEGADGDDDAVLLRLFAEEHSHTMAAVGAGRSGGAHKRSEHDSKDADDDVSIPLQLIEGLTRIPLPGGASHSGSGATFIEDVEQAMRAAFGVLGERVAIEDNEEDGPGAGGKREKRSRSRLPKSVRQALDEFEDAFVEAANAMEKAPEKSSHVLAYSSLCVRLVLRYRLKDGENRAAFWASVASLVKAMLCSLSSRQPLVSLLHQPGAPLPEEAARLLALLVALLSWHDNGGRLEGEGAAAGKPMRADVIREALAALDRAADVAVVPSPLPASLDEVFPDSPDVLPERLATLRDTQSASDKALSLKSHLEAVMRGEARPAAGPDGEIAREVRRTPPIFCVPWTTSCPRCHQSLAGVLLGRLLLRQPVRCLNTRCSRWLIPSEGS